MSKYSGKCDLYDSLIMIKDIKDYSKVKIYAYNNDIVPLRIDFERDAMPFYPYLTTIMSGDKDGNTIIHLSSESYVDTNENEHLSWYLEDIKKYWRKCKRKKIEFNEEEAAKLIMWCNEDLPSYKEEIIKRVKEQGEKATIKNIHTPLHDYYRKYLYDDMVDAGWDKRIAYRWVYGWQRYWEKIKEGNLDDNNSEK